MPKPKPSPRPITIRKERYYPHPPEDVWAAISDPHALAEWFEPNNHKPVAGHEFNFRINPGICGHGADGEVLEAEAPRRLVWRWTLWPGPKGKPISPMTVAWTLTPRGEGTVLVLEHSEAENIGWGKRTMMRIGWGMMMKKLIPKVLKNVRDGVFTPGAIPLAKRYYKCETVPEEYVR